MSGNIVIGLDIGGTKAAATAFESSSSFGSLKRSGAGRTSLGGKQYSLKRLAPTASVRIADYGTLDSVLNALESQLPESIVFEHVGSIGVAAAGITTGMKVVHPQYPGGAFDFQTLTARSLATVTLMNDFGAEARALSSPLIHEGAIALGPEVHPEEGTVAVIGPGTGLGHAILCRRGTFRVIKTTEAGHMALPFRDIGQIEILQELAKANGGHIDGVVAEAFCSGRGLTWLRSQASATPVDQMDPIDPATLDPWVVEQFAYLTGLQAANFVVGVGAWNGLYFSGGVLKRTPELLTGAAREHFLRGFLSVPRHRNTMSKMPIWVVREADTGTIGAALQAVDPIEIF